MEEELGRDIVDGKIIDWSTMSTEELKKMRETLKAKETELLNQIDKELEKKENKINL